MVYVLATWLEAVFLRIVQTSVPRGFDSRERKLGRPLSKYLRSKEFLALRIVSRQFTHSANSANSEQRDNEG